MTDRLGLSVPLDEPLATIPALARWAEDPARRRAEVLRVLEALAPAG